MRVHDKPENDLIPLHLASGGGHVNAALVEHGADASVLEEKNRLFCIGRRKADMWNLLRRFSSKANVEWTRHQRARLLATTLLLFSHSFM